MCVCLCVSVVAVVGGSNVSVLCESVTGAIVTIWGDWCLVAVGGNGGGVFGGAVSV